MQKHWRISTVTLRFSPRLGFSPVARALANSKAAIAVLAGPTRAAGLPPRMNATHQWQAPPAAIAAQPGINPARYVDGTLGMVLAKRRRET